MDDIELKVQNLIVLDHEQNKLKDFVLNLGKENPGLLVLGTKVIVKMERKWDMEKMKYNHIPRLYIKKKHRQTYYFNLSNDFVIEEVPTKQSNLVSFKLISKEVEPDETRTSEANLEEIREALKTREEEKTIMKDINETRNEEKCVVHISEEKAKKIKITLENFIKPKISYISSRAAKSTFYDALLLVDKEKFKKLIFSHEPSCKQFCDLLFNLWTSQNREDRDKCLTLIICVHYRKQSVGGVEIFWKGEYVTVGRKMTWTKILELFG